MNPTTKTTPTTTAAVPSPAPKMMSHSDLLALWLDAEPNEVRRLNHEARAAAWGDEERFA
jgi:hypothetical protein